jgi:DNA-directed RNA polymerase subunit RPC12/RpoP
MRWDDEPVGIDIKDGEYIIYYRCQKCGYKFQVKASPQDNFEAILSLSKHLLK